LDNGGVVIEGTKNLLQHATDYYKNLFGPGNLFPISPNLWSASETLTDEDNIDLTRPFSMEEVKNDLFEMDVNRAPGPDEIPSEFYQHCWDIVKFDIMSLFDHFYAGTLDVQRLNYGIITLLPKVIEANKIQQFRPICLLRCMYKLITKTLTLRVEPYIHKLITIQQNAFIRGRNIMDSVLSLHEIMHILMLRSRWVSC
jgi:hypothetical protein